MATRAERYVRQIPANLSASFLSLAEAEFNANPKARHTEMKRLQAVIGEGMAVADLAGRGQTVREAARIANDRTWDGAVIFAAGSSEPTQVTFEQAIDDLLGRTPALAETWEEVAALYSERHAFSIVQSSDLNVTKHVQKAIARLMKAGEDVPTAKQVLSDLGGFSDAYAETVYRTNLSTAYSAGRFKQATHPDVAKVIGAFEFRAVNDPDVRHNHLAAHTLLASQFDPVWDAFTPPLGFNCRCRVRLVDRFKLQRLGLLEGNRVTPRYPSTFAAAHPDKGFGQGRPDRRLYS